MKIAVSLDKDGMLPDRFGKLSPESLRRDGNNICSFPISISDVPAGAKSLALSFVDFDSIPVCGFCLDSLGGVRYRPRNGSYSRKCQPQRGISVRTGLKQLHLPCR